ncbi:unnamed protein product [Amoebophrya sp. A120]|nr:unnamed protein product [Amoebophrya sp. A120]|eukprot:GSA120T00007339001.1
MYLYNIFLFVCVWRSADNFAYPQSTSALRSGSGRLFCSPVRHDLVATGGEGAAAGWLGRRGLGLVPCVRR